MRWRLIVMSVIGWCYEVFLLSWLDEIVLQNLKLLKHWLNFIKIVDQIQLHMPAMSSNLRPDGPEDWGSSHYFQTYPSSSFKCKCKYWQTVYKTTCACALSLLESCAFWLCKVFVHLSREYLIRYRGLQVLKNPESRTSQDFLFGLVFRCY